jgi:hypothetical protein
MEVSGLSDNDFRTSLLQTQLNAITSNFTVALERLSSQASAQDEQQKVMFENQKELSNLLIGIIRQSQPSVLVTHSNETNTTAIEQTPYTSLQANHLLSTDLASDPKRTAGTGS